MALFQFFLLINLSYILLLGLCALVVFLVLPIDSLVLGVSWLPLAGLVLLGFFFVNFFIHRHRYFLLFMQYKNEIGAFAQFLHGEYTARKFKSERNLIFYLQICFLANRLDFIEELLTGQVSRPHGTRFLLDGAGFYILQGKLKEAYAWLSLQPKKGSFMVQWTRNVLEGLSSPSEPKPEIFASFEEKTFSCLSVFSPTGFKALRVLNLYFYSIFASKDEKGKYKSAVETLSLDQAKKEYETLSRFPLYFMAISVFWSEALTSLFDKKLIK